MRDKHEKYGIRKYRRERKYMGGKVDGCECERKYAGGATWSGHAQQDFGRGEEQDMELKKVQEEKEVRKYRKL